MKKNFLYFVSLLFLLFVLSSCKTTCCHNITPVSFGVNSHVLNTATVSKVYVDNNEIGVIPGTTDTIKNCESPENLTVEFGESGHLYEIIVFDESGDTIAVKQGEFDVTDGDCIKIFFDLTE